MKMADKCKKLRLWNQETTASDNRRSASLSNSVYTLRRWIEARCRESLYGLWNRWFGVGWSDKSRYSFNQYQAHLLWNGLCLWALHTRDSASAGITLLNAEHLFVGMASCRPWACGTDCLSGLPDAPVAGADTGIPEWLAGLGDQCWHPPRHLAWKRCGGIARWRRISGSDTK